MKAPSNGVKKAMRLLTGGTKKKTDCDTTTGFDLDDVEKPQSSSSKIFFGYGLSDFEKVDSFEKNGDQAKQFSASTTNTKPNEKSLLKRYRSMISLSREPDFKKETEKSAPGSNACDIIRHRLGSVRKRFRRHGKSKKDVSLKNDNQNTSQTFPIRRLSDASETLRNCMNRLEHLSQRLETVSLVSWEMEHYKDFSANCKSQSDESTMQGDVSSSELVEETTLMKTDNQYRSKSVQSDENPIGHYEENRDTNWYFSLPVNSAIDMYGREWDGVSWKDAALLSQGQQKRGCESLSSGYSSASSEVQSLNWYQQQFPSVCFNKSYYYPSFIATDTQYPDCIYRFEQGYQNFYAPASIVSSGVFEEGMQYDSGSYQEYQAADSDYSPQLSNGIDLQFASDAFCHPTAQFYSFSNMASTTGFDPYTFDTSFEKQELKKFGSFRCRNGERTAVVVGSENRKRKTVRFSKTVEEKTNGEKTGKEVASPTSEEKEEAESDDFPSDHSHDSDSGQREAYNPTHPPIYEFPTGHIETSCMCSDCILARGSCQLQAAENFVYY